MHVLCTGNNCETKYIVPLSMLRWTINVFCYCQTISATHPDIVMVELCKARMNILHMDEELILKEAQDMSLAKIRQAIRQVGSYFLVLV